MLDPNRMYCQSRHAMHYFPQSAPELGANSGYYLANHVRPMLGRCRTHVFWIDQVHDEVPFLLGHLRDAQSCLFECLEMLEDTTLFRVLLKLLELDDLGKFLSIFHMHHVPLRLLRI